MNARFREDGTLVTYERLAVRTVEALRSLVRDAQEDLKVTAHLVRLVKAGKVQEARRVAAHIDAYLAKRQATLEATILPAIAGLEQDVQEMQRLQADQRDLETSEARRLADTAAAPTADAPGASVPDRSRRTH